MKHRFYSVLLCCVLFFPVVAPAGASTAMPSSPGQIREVTAKSSESTYTDPKTNLTFVVPANWTESPLSEERETINVKFTSTEDDSTMILYGSIDLWDAMTASERSGYTRSDIDNGFFNKSDLADIFGVTNNELKSVFYGNQRYYTATVITNAELYGVEFAVNTTQMICIENGYLYFFQFSSTGGDKLYSDFEALLTSVEYPTPAAPETPYPVSSPYSLGNILLNLVITIAIYSLPIIFYRYDIKRTPVERKKAKIITIIYGICAFIILAIIIFATGGTSISVIAFFFWSWVNYRILISGTPAPPPPDDAPTKTVLPPDELPSGTPQPPTTSALNITDISHATVENNPPTTSKKLSNAFFLPEVRYCRKCGNSLLPDSDFCSKCGTPVIKE